MTFDLASIASTKSPLPPKMVIVGPGKVGKSTFAAQSPGAVFLPKQADEKRSQKTLMGKNHEQKRRS